MGNSNTNGMFEYFNETLANVASNAGVSPMNWNSNAYSLVRSIRQCNSPLAALIITFILCYELIQKQIEWSSSYQEKFKL